MIKYSNWCFCSFLSFIFFIPLSQTVSVINKNGTCYFLDTSNKWHVIYIYIYIVVVQLLEKFKRWFYSDLLKKKFIYLWYFGCVYVTRTFDTPNINYIIFHYIFITCSLSIPHENMVVPSDFMIISGNRLILWWFQGVWKK